jgi:hypothetical protein
MDIQIVTNVAPIFKMLIFEKGGGIGGTENGRNYNGLRGISKKPFISAN